MVRLLVAALALLAAGCASAPPPLPGGHVVKTRGGETYVRDWGEASGPPVLLIHGTTSHLEDWDVALGSEFTGNYRLIAYDRPGMGRSTHRPADAAKLVVQADTAADVIRAEHPGGKVVVVGHSYGGAVALRLALDHPDLVSGLVLLAPASHPWGGGAPFFYKLESAPVIGEIDDDAGLAIQRPGGAGFAEKSRFCAPPCSARLFRTGGCETGACAPAALRASAADFAALPKELEAQAKRYGELTLPVAVIRGEQDHVVPVRLVREKSSFRHGRVVFIPGAGHMVQHAAQQQIDDQIGWVLSEAAKPD